MDLITLLCWAEFLVGAAIAAVVWLRIRRRPDGWFRVWADVATLGFLAGLFFGTIIAEEPLWAPLAGLVFGPLAALGGLTDNIMINRAAERDAARRAEVKQRREALRALFQKKGAPSDP